MKKIILVFVLSVFAKTFSQETSNGNEVDLVNRTFLSEIKKIDLVTDDQKNYVIKTLQDYISKSKDSIFISQANDYISELTSKEMVAVRKVDLSKLSEEDLKKFNVKTDDFKESTFITLKKYYDNFRAYIGLNEDELYLRLRSKYEGRDWIFMDDALFIIDGEKYDLSLGETDRKVVTNGVIEKSDILVDDYILNILTKIVQSQSEVKVRFVGKYSKDFVISANDIKGLSRVLELRQKLLDTSN